MREWRTARLGEVCSFEKNQHIHVGLPYVGLEHIESGTGRFLGTADAVTVKSATFRFLPSHVLYGRLRAYLNKVFLPDFEGHCSTEIFPINPGPTISREYLFHWLSADATVKAIDATSTGARMPRANMSAVLDLKLPIPPLIEQRRIVALLDEAFEGIATAKANAEKNLQSARELFASALAKIFNADWTVVRIADACESIMDCVNKTAPTVAEATPYKMIRTTNVRNGVVSLVSTNYVSEDVFKVWTRRQVPRRGDVILTREAPMGEVGMLESDEHVFLGQRLVSYRADSTKLDGRFLLYALQSDLLQRQIHALASGSTVQHMRVPDSKNLQLPLPTLQEQRDAVAILDAVRDETSNLATICSRKLAALAELKSALLHQAFTGNLITEEAFALVEARA